ncbi:MAG TPA: cupredoxin domain-containing protein [Thermoplasmataceae archaeon]|nr:cupredoxin domain-containing protein [Thermoplasmataceae archaeon]
MLLQNQQLLGVIRLAVAKGGVALAVVIVAVVAVSVGYILTSPSSTGLTPTSNDFAQTKYTQYVHLYADGNGWDYYYYQLGKGPINPVIYVKTGTTVVFNVTEEDDLPHTLTIAFDGSPTSTLGSSLISNPSQINSNPTKYENTGGSYTIISESQLGQTPGVTVQGKYPFLNPGVYTYWCLVHPTTMFGLIIVGSNASANVTSGNAHPLSSGLAVTCCTASSLTLTALEAKD